MLWALSPYITWAISRRLPRRAIELTTSQIRFLYTTARKTWAFFERLVTENENWLPPDNLQLYPTTAIAHRTSPTNIGMSLLAGLTAHDFGYLSTVRLLERTAGTIGTLNKMGRYNGHFYNWYNTLTLAPLLPEYISTVDSGNLAGHLLTLRQGLFEILHAPVIHPRIFEGLEDTFSALRDNIAEEERSYLNEFSSMLTKAIAAAPPDAASIAATLKLLAAAYRTAVINIHAEKESDAEWWLSALSNQLIDTLEDLEMLYPWLDLPEDAKSFAVSHFPAAHFSMSGINNQLTAILAQLREKELSGALKGDASFIEAYRSALELSQRNVEERISKIESLGHACIGLADMDWRFLYNKSKHLLSIGYRVQDRACDTGYYDLLASEARLGIFVAIAQGKLPEDSWFALGRQLTNVQGDLTLLSWSGSMFEYLMPLLVMPTYENTLLDETYKASVKRQIAYGRQRSVPWGISESGFNRVDAGSNYQYRAFGVPGLGMKRGLETDLVIAPYASALALMVAPEAACDNLELMQRDGYEGLYGFYEAVDFTPSRLQRNQASAIIQSFMAHHQGMSLLSIGYILLNQPMQRRFESEPQFKATMLLLQERVPRASSFYAHTNDMEDVNITSGGTHMRVLTTPDTPVPEVHLLSNGTYHLMVTNAGGSYSRWRDLSVTRWREDATCDNYGVFCYIRDVETGAYWSTTYQPTSTKGSAFEVVFTQGRADFHNSDGGIEAHTEIVVSPEDDIEIRRLTLTNKLNLRRTIEVTSYAEIVVAQQASDQAQQAFSNLFVQTEILASQQAIICTRRPRSAQERPPWMFHSMIVKSPAIKDVSFETDRMAFLGHGNTPVNPKAMNRPGPLTNTEGSVLDPIVAVRHKLILEPGESKTLDLIIGIAETREACENLIEKYSDRDQKERVFELAWTHSQVILRQINATEEEEQLFGRLAGSIIYMNPAVRADASVLIKNKRGQSGLWGYSISGDLPIVLLQIADPQHIELARQLIKAHVYWRLKGLLVDLVIWNEDHDVYRQAFQAQIQALIPQDLADRPGGVFLRVADQISTEDRILFQTVARIMIGNHVQTLAGFLNEEPAPKPRIPYLKKDDFAVIHRDELPPSGELLFFNGTGGFSVDGKEYVIEVDEKNRTPLPWVNVIANPVFGTVISESGQSYTWTENAHELRLTPWSNDPVMDNGGEAFYLRDEQSGHYWSATPLPRGGSSRFVIRHGFGYSTFQHTERGIFSELSVYVDQELPVKYSKLKIRNNSGIPRRISVTGYVEWVLGDVRTKTAMHIHTGIDSSTGASFAENRFSTAFGNRVAFFDTDEPVKNATCDRTDFIGRNNSLENPDALLRVKLSGNSGVALDPCAAIQVVMELAEGDEREIIFTLGVGRDMRHARDLVAKSRGSEAADKALEKVAGFWQETTGALQIETPDEALNVLANGWLTYQTIACRLWARSGFYQSGGAFGFRDQLQDVLSVLYTRPELARKQIILCASHQFEEGDVQHWWHPPIGQGVRTRISDDYLWLPFVTSRYVLHTGDAEILDVRTNYLKERLLHRGEESYYGMPEESWQIASVYDHCVAAIRNGLKFGKHGLPLMGAGDWNDGMDKVGIEGEGESIWLGWFLYDVLNRFSKIASMRNDATFAEQCIQEAERLRAAIQASGWDGLWYRRAYFDDGSPLGSSENTDGRIDAIAQSWSVLSGGAQEQYFTKAMESAEKWLVKKEAGIIQLLDPPFDKGPENPGYIKGYVPGVRGKRWAVHPCGHLADYGLC